MLREYASRVDYRWGRGFLINHSCLKISSSASQESFTQGPSCSLQLRSASGLNMYGLYMPARMYNTGDAFGPRKMRTGRRASGFQGWIAAVDASRETVPKMMKIMEIDGDIIDIAPGSASGDYIGLAGKFVFVVMEKFILFVGQSYGYEAFQGIRGGFVLFLKYF